jgi:hypothetical protein
MISYTRPEPFYALCGLNCCLCPRFNTDGASKCPGCGGKDFSEKHPTCAVVTCSKKHGDIQFCFDCVDFPCKRFEKPSAVDSFISYKNVLDDMEKAKKDLKGYLKDLKKKYEYLCLLLEQYNDGKSKGFYCLAVNLLPLPEITELIKFVQKDKTIQALSLPDKAKTVVKLFKERGDKLNIELSLRK